MFQGTTIGGAAAAATATTNDSQTGQAEVLILPVSVHCVQERVQVERDMGIEKSTSGVRMGSNTLKER